jgi:hypothetical protein
MNDEVKVSANTTMTEGVGKERRLFLRVESAVYADKRNMSFGSGDVFVLDENEEIVGKLFAVQSAIFTAKVDDFGMLTVTVPGSTGKG